MECLILLRGGPGILVPVAAGHVLDATDGLFGLRADRGESEELLHGATVASPTDSECSSADEPVAEGLLPGQNAADRKDRPGARALTGTVRTAELSRSGWF
ncbi:hypothetical protein GCM10027444_42450 [Actinopolyspora lacussalsi]